MVSSGVKRRRRDPGTDDRGAMTVMVALMMTLLLGAAALSVDMGHVLAARTESQRVADLAALAGAGAYIESAAPNISAAVDARAKGFASQNLVDGSPVSLLSVDIQPDPPNERVTVVVHHTEGRGNAVAVVFGRVFGLTSVDVVTRATAEASPASAVSCALPLFLVDRWTELGGDPDRFDAGIDHYEAYDPAAPTTTYTGYDAASIGTSIVAEPAGATASDQGRPMPDWYFPFGAVDLPGGAGSYQLSIEDCLDPGMVYAWADDIVADPTPQPTATSQGFQTLIAADPEAVWDPGTRCVVDIAQLGSGDPTNCRSSPRLRPAVLLDPGQAPGAVPQGTAVTNLAGVFVEGVAGSEIALVITGYTGVRAARASGGGFTPPLVRKVRLVE